MSGILYSASENIHHPLIESEEIMDLTVFATLQRPHQFINFAYFCITAINIQIKRLHGLEEPPIYCITCIIISN